MGCGGGTEVGTGFRWFWTWNLASELELGLIVWMVGFWIWVAGWIVQREFLKLDVG